MNAVDVVARHQIANDRVDVGGGRGENRGDVQAFDRWLGARPSRDLPDVSGAFLPDARQLLREIARNHQPLGMPMDDVGRGNREIRRARDQVDVDPRVNAKARTVRRAKDGGQRVERRGQAIELRRARLETAVEVRVASSAYLHEQRVEAVIARRANQRRDRFGGGQRRSQHPERARFGDGSCGRGAAKMWAGSEAGERRHHQDRDSTAKGGANSEQTHKSFESNSLPIGVSTQLSASTRAIMMMCKPYW